MDGFACRQFKTVAGCHKKCIDAVHCAPNNIAVCVMHTLLAYRLELPLTIANYIHRYDVLSNFVCHL